MEVPKGVETRKHPSSKTQELMVCNKNSCQLFKTECRDRPHLPRLQLSPHPFLHPGQSTDIFHNCIFGEWSLLLHTIDACALAQRMKKFTYSATKNVMSGQNRDGSWESNTRDCPAKIGTVGNYAINIRNLM